MKEAHLDASTNYQKYQTSNPLMRRIIHRFLGTVLQRIEEMGPRRVVDLGCGEGIVAQALLERVPGVEYLGVDLSPGAVQAARAMNPGAEFEVGSILDEPSRPGWADLVICLEVLEHLERPDLAADQALRWTAEGALFSVPWEPWFRVGNFFRGKYLSRWGNHPEHVQSFTPVTLRRLLESKAETVEISTCFPWILAQVCVR